MEQVKKFISPGAWFSMNYPAVWNEFEDTEESFLFTIPTSGPAISAYLPTRGLPDLDRKR